MLGVQQNLAIEASSKVEARGLQAMPEFLANAGIVPETEEMNGRRVFTTRGRLSFTSYLKWTYSRFR